MARGEVLDPLLDERLPNGLSEGNKDRVRIRVGWLPPSDAHRGATFGTYAPLLEGFSSVFCQRVPQLELGHV